MLLRSGVAFCPSIDYLERAWQDAVRGRPSEAPVPRGRGADDDRRHAHRRRRDRGDDVHPVRALQRGGLAGGLARALRAAVPRHAGRGGAEREGRGDPPRGARRRRTSSASSACSAATSSRASRAWTRWRSCGRRRRWRSTRRRSTGCTCAARARTRAAGSWPPAGTTRPSGSSPTSGGRSCGAPVASRDGRRRGPVVTTLDLTGAHPRAGGAPVAGAALRRGGPVPARGEGRAARASPTTTSRASSREAMAAELHGGLHAREHGGQGWTKLEWVLVEEQFGRSTNALSWHIPTAYNVLARRARPSRSTAGCGRRCAARATTPTR